MAEIVKANIANALNSLSGVLGTSDQIVDSETGKSIKNDLHDLEEKWFYISDLALDELVESLTATTIGKLNSLRESKEDANNKVLLIKGDSGSSLTYAVATVVEWGNTFSFFVDDNGTTVYVQGDQQNNWTIARSTPLSSASVLYTPQTLTDAQKQQARENIGAGTGGGSGDAVLYTPQSLTEQEKKQALQNIGVNNTRYSILNVRLNVNTGAYVTQNNGALCVQVKKGDRVEIINTLNVGTYVTFTTDVPVVGTASASSVPIRNTNILYMADADGYVTVSSNTTIADYVTVYLNGVLVETAGTYQELADYVNSKMQQEQFPVITEIEQGSLSNTGVTTQARTKNYIPGRCIIVIGDDYFINSVEISNRNNTSYHRRLNFSTTFVSNVVTFNYETPIKFTVKRKDGAAISSSEYASIIQSITPYVGEFPYSSADIKVHTTIAPDVVDYLTNVVYTDDYTYSAVATALQNHTFNELPFERCLPVRLDWTPLNDVKNYVVILDTQSGGGVTLSKTPYFTNKNSIDIYNLLPNTTYNYIVIAVGIDGNTQMITYDRFTTADTPLRILNLPNTTNVRDLGGWTAGTRKVKYGRLFRGAAMSRREGFVINPEGVDQACRFLHVAKEIGLGVGYSLSPITQTTQYIDIPVSGYYLGVKPISDGGSGANYVRILGEIISTLSSNTTDSVIFHCAGGADRTGTLSWLLLGLLGVSESDMSKDYELTSFTKSANRRERNSSEFVEMVNYIKTLDGTTIQEKIETWWLAQGATSAQITSFRNLMLQ